MLPSMDNPEPEPSPPSPASSQLELPVVAPGVAGASTTTIEDIDVPRGCPFLLAEGGGWRLDLPSREHRCAAVSPAAPLSPEKQARLCLTASHPTCATYQASMSARSARLGIPSGDRTTRWALARTTTVVEDAGGLRGRFAALLLDRRRWPAIPAVVLIGTLFTLAVSGLNGASKPVSATAGPSGPAVTPGLTAEPTPRPTGTPEPEPTSASTTAPSAAPSQTPAGSQGPTASFRTYKVKSGDTLSGIASQFGTTSRAIAELNGITVSTTLHIGQVLSIPNPS
jgi:LysM repeat protein